MFDVMVRHWSLGWCLGLEWVTAQMSHPQVYIHGDLIFVTVDGVKVDTQVRCAVQ